MDVKTLTDSAKRAYDDKKTYEEKLEQAGGKDIYKYVLLINGSALDGFVAQARLQAKQSFDLSRIVALSGFVIIAAAIALSVRVTTAGNENLTAAYLAGIAGVITEFIAGVFFWLYSKTLDQINRFHDRLADMQKTALAHIAAAGADGTSAPSAPPAGGAPAA